MKFFPLLIKLWISQKFRQLKGNYSSITGDILMKLRVHYQSMVRYVQYMFDEIPSVMAEDGHWKDGWKDRQAGGWVDGQMDNTEPISLLRS